MDFLTQLDHNFIDVNVLFFIQEYLRFEWMTPIWKFITWLGDAGWFWIALSVILLIPKRTRKIGAAALISLLIGALITNVALKNLVARTRRYEVIDGLILLVDPQHDFSFPSGHSCASFAAAMVYYKMFPKKYGVPAVNPGNAHRAVEIICGSPLSVGCSRRNLDRYSCSIGSHAGSWERKKM